MNVLQFLILFIALVAAAQTFRPRVIEDKHPVVAPEAWPLAADRRSR